MSSEKNQIPPDINYWEQVFNKINDIVIIINKDFEIENINEAGKKTFQIEDDWPHGRKKCFDSICNLIKPPANCPLNCFLSNHEQKKDQIVEIGNKIFKVSLSRIEGIEGETEKYIDILHDITSQFLAERSLKEQVEEYETLNEEYLSTNEELTERNTEYQLLNEDYRNAIDELKTNNAALLVSKKQVEQSEKKFKAIFNLTESLICIADIHTATFIDINPAFSKVLGFAQEELLSNPLLILYTPMTGKIPLT
jgi:molecular chaperone DnaK (HSP70)